MTAPPPPQQPRRVCGLLAFGIAAAAAFAFLAPAPVRAAQAVQMAPAPSLAVSPSSSAACAPHAAEAAARSALPASVILRVMHVESRGRVNAISPKGAMGCMQIMPATWRYLTARHRLGADPWNARFNMIGGALYLAELARQFGFPGAYAAYNAGPARYARHVRGAASLPAETVAYMASLSGSAAPRRAEAQRGAPLAPRWQEAQLFLRVELQRGERGDRPRVARGSIMLPGPASAMAKTVNAPTDRAQQLVRPPRSELFPFARSGDDRTEGDHQSE